MARAPSARESVHSRLVDYTLSSVSNGNLATEVDYKAILLNVDVIQIPFFRSSLKMEMLVTTHSCRRSFTHIHVVRVILMSGLAKR